MRKLVLGIAVVGLVGFVSCKKDYTCDCKVDAPGVSVESSLELNGFKEDDASSSCESTKAELDEEYGSGTAECNLMAK